MNSAEICIPTHRVPPEILQKLKEIGLLLQSESVVPIPSTGGAASIPSSSSSCTASSSPCKGSLSVSSRKEADECDDLAASGSVVHVLGADGGTRTKNKEDSDVVSLFDQSKDNSSSGGGGGVVSVLDPQTDNDSSDAVSGGSSSNYEQRKDVNDVVSLFDLRHTPASTDAHNCGGSSGGGSGSGGATTQAKMESEAAAATYEANRSSPQKDFISQFQTSRPFQHPYPQPHVATPYPPTCSQNFSGSSSQQQYSAKSSSFSSSLLEVPQDPYALLSQHQLQYQHQQRLQHCSSPVQPLSGGLPELEEERCGSMKIRSPCKTPTKRYEDSLRQQHPGSFVHRPDTTSPSMSEASTFSSSSSSSSSGTITATTSSSSSSQSFRSRSPSLSCSNEDDLARGGIPAAASATTPGGEAGQKSPKVLTPPETPENDSKRVVPEVFTFDDITCTQERLRHMWEKLTKLHEQFTPTKRSPSTPRTHPPSTPPTPSYRRQEQGPPLPTTPVRRLSPVDSPIPFLHRIEAVAASAAVSPQSKLKTSSSDMPGSPGAHPPPPPPPLPSTPQRMSVSEAEFAQRRAVDSVSPKPKKRLSFDEDGGSSHPMLQAQQQQQQRLRSYDPSAATASVASGYPLVSPRASGSAPDFPFTPYCGEGQQQQQQGFGRGSSPTKSARSFAEFQKLAASLAAFQEGMESEDDFDDDSERGGGAGPLFSGTRHVYESIEFQNRLAMQNGRYTPKRKRSELMDDGSDVIALCTCREMERNFLQMAECAYKRIRRKDASPADFDRFRNELAQTNEILRESMGLMKHIRDLCDHRKRPRW